MEWAQPPHAADAIMDWRDEAGTPTRGWDEGVAPLIAVPRYEG